MEKIRSKYILKQIFDNIQQIRLLEMIRYNNGFKKKLEKNLNVYKKEFLKIEIEIIPKDEIYGDCNILNKKYKSYAHIYFNDDKVEKKVNTFNKNDNIKKIKIILDYKIKSLTKIFKDCYFIKSINFIRFIREDIIDMSYMFYMCSSLEELIFTNIKTNNIINM